MSLDNVLSSSQELTTASPQLKKFRINDNIVKIKPEKNNYSQEAASEHLDEIYEQIGQLRHENMSMLAELMEREDEQDEVFELKNLIQNQIEKNAALLSKTKTIPTSILNKRKSSSPKKKVRFSSNLCDFSKYEKELMKVQSKFKKLQDSVRRSLDIDKNSKIISFYKSESNTISAKNNSNQNDPEKMTKSDQERQRKEARLDKICEDLEKKIHNLKKSLSEKNQAIKHKTLILNGFKKKLQFAKKKKLRFEVNKGKYVEEQKMKERAEKLLLKKQISQRFSIINSPKKTKNVVHIRSSKGSQDFERASEDSETISQGFNIYKPSFKCLRGISKEKLSFSDRFRNSLDSKALITNDISKNEDKNRSFTLNSGHYDKIKIINKFQNDQFTDDKIRLRERSLTSSQAHNPHKKIQRRISSMMSGYVNN
ncbi:unnamed protein product [Moneuplotes crassus]|uniref:Uncharacterized protein n=1 Tax=Euplotes crassus TaxID=5936 RepID=A0AAD1UAF5_EUPCR|nr:unnamed protein product [Moneuplotes crassus]